MTKPLLLTRNWNCKYYFLHFYHNKHHVICLDSSLSLRLLIENTKNEEYLYSVTLDFLLSLISCSLSSHQTSCSLVLLRLLLLPRETGWCSCSRWGQAPHHLPDSWLCHILAARPQQFPQPQASHL